MRRAFSACVGGGIMGRRALAQSGIVMPISLPSQYDGWRDPLVDT
jgi:hypothetical protein